MKEGLKSKSRKGRESKEKKRVNRKLSNKVKEKENSFSICINNKYRNMHKDRIRGKRHLKIQEIKSTNLQLQFQKLKILKIMIK